MTAVKKLLIPGVAALLGVIVLVGLGVWQLERLHWKEALIARVDAGLTASPVAAPPQDHWADLDLPVLEYQPVSVTGRYLNDREADVVFTLTAPKGPHGGIGYLIMTPLETADGWYVYVNRGFVPKDRKDPSTRQSGLIEGEISVAGLLRRPRGRDWFMPGDDIAGNQWLSRDPQAFAQASGLPPEKVAPYIIDARFDANLPGGLPQGGETIVAFPNNHLQYAITWFGLAIGLVAVFIAFARGRLIS